MACSGDAENPDPGAAAGTDTESEASGAQRNSMQDALERMDAVQAPADGPVSAEHQIDVRFPYESADGFSRPQAGRETRPNVLLITLDTVRKDRLSLYGYPYGTSPNLDAMAEEGVTFDNAYASAPVTLPSHSTILTGLEPFAHGVRNNGIHSLAPEFQTLAEATRSMGYATGAIVGAFPVASQFGLNQGFDHYDDDFSAGEAGNPVPQRLADEVSRRGLDWIKSAATGPWFCWLHYFDPHDPYDAPGPYGELLDNPYDEEIVFTDAHLGGLFRELQRHGLWKNTLVVVTADHGEGLMDHQEPTHSLFIYNTTVAVPLVMKLPDGGPWAGEKFRNRRIPALSATTDIFPTVMDVLGGTFQPGAPYPGQSLIPAIVDGQSPRNVAYMETLIPQLDYGWSPYRGIVAEDHKYIMSTKPEMFDLKADPGELRNKIETDTERADRLLEMLADRMEHDHTSTTMAMDAATIQKLRSLGYIAGGGASSDGPLPDAKDMLWVIDAFDQARSSISQKDFVGAKAGLDRILAKDPKNRFARRMQTWVLLRLGEGAAAEDLAKAVLREEADAADVGVTELRLAEAILIQGQSEKANDILTRVLPDQADSFEAWTLRVRTAGAVGDFAEARKAADKAAEANPEAASNGSPQALLGRAFEAHGRWEEARDVYDAALEKHGPQIELLAGKAMTELRIGDPQAAVNTANRIVSADPSHGAGNFILGSGFVLAGQPGQAMPFFIKAVQAEPANPHFQARLGNHCLSGQNFPKAVEHLTKALELGKDDASTRAGLGMAQAALGDTNLARENLQKALTQDPPERLRAQIEASLKEIG